MKTIYIAGPFTDDTAWGIEENIRRAERWGLVVAETGAVPVIPHTMYRFFHGQRTADFWYDATLELCKRCDAILMIPEWHKSSGSHIERAQMVNCGKKVFDVDHSGVHVDARVLWARRKIKEWLEKGE